MTPTFEPKDPEEIIVLTFDFSSELNGAVLTAPPVVTANVVSGEDANPANIFNGAATLGATNTAVMQSVRAGLVNVNYRIKVKCSTNDGRTLVRAGILPIRDA